MHAGRGERVEPAKRAHSDIRSMQNAPRNSRAMWLHISARRAVRLWIARGAIVNISLN